MPRNIVALDRLFGAHFSFRDVWDCRLSSRKSSMDIDEGSLRIQGIVSDIKKGVYNLSAKVIAAVVNGEFGKDADLESPRSLVQAAENLFLCATVENCADLLHHLLRAGVSPDCPNLLGTVAFPLYLAAIKGLHEVIQILVERGQIQTERSLRNLGMNIFQEMLDAHL